MMTVFAKFVAATNTGTGSMSGIQTNKIPTFLFDYLLGIWPLTRQYKQVLDSEVWVRRLLAEETVFLLSELGFETDEQFSEANNSSLKNARSWSIFVTPKVSSYNYVYLIRNCVSK